MTNRLEHPRAAEDGVHPPSAVSVAGERVPVDEDGFFEVPEDVGESWIRSFEDRYGVSFGTDGDVVYEEDGPPDDEDDEDRETCQDVKNDGDVCGRALPCPYHSDDQEA